jgi:hypothetical protein
MCETKCRIAMAKAAFNKKRALFTSTLDLELRKKLVKCYICDCIESSFLKNPYVPFTLSLIYIC